MRASNLKTVVLLASVCIVSACNQGSGATADQPLDLRFKPVEFKRQGGKECPLNTQQVQEDSLCATVLFKYPEVNSAENPALADTLNQLIHQQLLDTLEEDNANTVAEMSFEQLAQNFIEDYQQEGAFTPWSLERKVDIAYQAPQLLTLVLDEYSYLGGAHPASGTRYTVINLRDGKTVGLADLLSNGYEVPLNVAGEKAFREARNLPEAANLEEQGFTFENNVFSLNENFGVLEDGLKFVFNSYEIAPYALGPTDILIPYDDIRSLVRPEGPLAAVAH